MTRAASVTLLLASCLTASTVAAGEAGTKKLLTTIDCTKEYGPDAYFGFGDVRVTQSAAGGIARQGRIPSRDSGTALLSNMSADRIWP